MVRRDKQIPSWSNSSESRDQQHRHRYRRAHHHHTPPHPDNGVTMLRSLHPKLDPNQTYVLSGPVIKYDETLQSYVHVFSARPIPPGMTVIATPSQSPPDSTSSSSTDNHHHLSRAFPESITLTSSPPTLNQVSSTKFNPNALPFIPKTIETDLNVKISDKTLQNKENDTKSSQNPRSRPIGSETESEPGRRTPCFMYWSSNCPEGTLVPLRQPDPPVYFQTMASETR